jgi:phasin family protein
MKNQGFDTFTAQAQKFIAPIQQYNQLLAKNFEQLANVQLKAAEQYSKLSLQQVKAASEVKDALGLAAFNAKQFELYNSVSEQFNQDAKTLTNIAENFKKEVTSIVEAASKN